MLARVTKAKHCLEVGTFTGFGTLSMAENVPEDGTVTALELQEPVAKHARGNFDRSPHGKKITIKIGNDGS
jgi:caffeoyl-CoA O-methyltransferase